VSVTRTIETSTPHGTAVTRLHLVDGTRGLLALGHGAGGGIEAPDLVAVAGAARDVGVAVALVLQPYRVAGRAAPPRTPTLDAAWTAVLAHLGSEHPSLPVVVGGRSSGARVACRTVLATGAVGAVCLAFPLRPPGRPDAPSRLGELDDAGVPVLVVQGDRDPYGTPPARLTSPVRTVVTVGGDHSLRRDPAAVAAAVGPWLTRLLEGSPGPR
jgi:hypothetical protein